ncbi:PREDICTED: aldose 1-epimerase-like [Acromyrmex echinatior]|uniref:Galactose mutarotase n=1 Tax=Acromyrmex echinatior TaxID=103372 RepID=F4X2Q5_ACREC|nr:PREDICTED: aldose 1-epimerase-like [Acromyrmex echinatior]EGI59251.1 Aldose 1-epimerase [Acromyrmex echinatior]
MSFGDTLIEEDGFGFVPRLPGTELEKSREIVRRYTLTNKHKASVRLISWGASIQSIKVPNRDGKLADVVLGFDNMDGYLKNRYMGSIIDRVANCISGSMMHLDNVIYPLSINDRAGKDRLNGGTVVFDNTNWQSQIVNNRVVMSHLSQRYSQGYSSDVLTQIKYTWTDDNQLHINIRATSTSSTPVNITNYCLFNLAGHGTGSKELKKHILTVNADSWICMDVKNKLPNIICPVDGTECELRLPAQLNQRRLYDIPGGGYNHNLCVNSPSCWCYRFHARILHPTSGRFLEIYSNNPGLQVYTGNELPHQYIYPPDLKDHEWGNHKNAQINFWKSTKEITKKKATEVYGKEGVPYRRHGGFALSPQNYPNVGNINFPSCMLHPGKMYTHDMTYKFGVLFEE